MPEYDSNNTAVLFKNKKKFEEEGRDKWPDYTGYGEVEGVKVELAAWVRTAKSDGSKFMSLKMTPVEAEEDEIDESERAPEPNEEDDDGLPF